MKLIPVIYNGFTSMDRRFSGPMLPWIVAEIRRRKYIENLSVGVENSILQAYNQDFELQFTHRVNQILRFSQADVDACTFLYLLRDDSDRILYCYLYQAKKSSDVTDLYRQMKEQSHVTGPTRSLSSAATLTSLCVDISPSSSNFFEVLYIGKIKVWQKNVSETFIDDALEKFRLHELEKSKSRQLGSIGKLLSEDNIFQKGTNDTGAGTTSSELTPSPLIRSTSHHSSLGVPSKNQDRDVIDVQNLQGVQKLADVAIPEEDKAGEEKQDVENKNETDDGKSSVNMDDHNRTMVLQVDRTDLRLISPDRKVILLHKHHRDVTSCTQGVEKNEHFGFVCKENSNNFQTFVAYIFKCESGSIAGDAVAAITQAFLSSEVRTRSLITSCEHCPMVWFHKLCADVEHMSDKKTQGAILRKLEQLDQEEQMTILTKFRRAETDSVREQNEFLMMLLRAHCEMKQARHVHDTAENRSEFLNQYLGVGGSSMFTKAKKSLTNSFDQFLKRRASVDVVSNNKNMNLPITNNLNKASSPHSHQGTPSASISETSASDKESEGFRSRSSTIESQTEGRGQYLSVKNDKQGSISPDRSNTGSDKTPKSPMMDIFLKVGHHPSKSADDSTNSMDSGSWRQALFKKVVTPKPESKETQPRRKRTKEELRELWKIGIKQAILLVRMEKENARIKADQENSAVKRIKLEYDEMKPHEMREVMDVWEMVTNKGLHIKVEKKMLLQAIRQGVPRGKRGEVWQFLAEQHCIKAPPIDTNKFPNYNLPYDQLLRQLTSHQHAILIDLGRTFPNHSYFSSPLGPGQLALFNLLKAYSLLDPDVGYCQGLSFVAGVLLLHMEESKAFFLLRHLMFRRGMRVQYLPNMLGLQVKLYQLSRLLHDQIPELYEHFDFHEVAPTLYAAPWILTMFASQFPLGFVTRVFDLVFLEGPDVVFRVALALLTYHKDKLVLCDSFEDIMNYLKGALANVDKPTLDKVMKQVYTTDITRQLDEYKVEYHVLKEEMAAVQPQVETLHKLERQNKTLTEQNKTLMSQLELALSNVQRLEKTRVLQTAQLNRAEMQNRGLEVTIATLANYIGNLIDENKNLEVNDDVRRILSQISFTERKKQEPQQNNLMKMLQQKENRIVPPDRLMVKSLSTGKIALPNNMDQNMLRSNSLNTNAQIPIPELKNQMQQASPVGSTDKKSHFFSSSHSNILEQQRLNNSKTNLLNSRIDIKIQEYETNRKNSIRDELEAVKSPTHSIDSGVCTPSSPKTLNEREIDSESIPATDLPKTPDVHPLSNLGGDIHFTYSGTRELKSIKTLKNYQSNSSPNLINKIIQK